MTARAAARSGCRPAAGSRSPRRARHCAAARVRASSQDAAVTATAFMIVSSRFVPSCLNDGRRGRNPTPWTWKVAATFVSGACGRAARAIRRASSAIAVRSSAGSKHFHLRTHSQHLAHCVRQALDEDLRFDPRILWKRRVLRGDGVSRSGIHIAQKFHTGRRQPYSCRLAAQSSFEAARCLGPELCEIEAPRAGGRLIGHFELADRIHSIDANGRRPLRRRHTRCLPSSRVRAAISCAS